MTLARGGELRPVTRPRGLTVSRAVSRALNAAGLAECVTYAFLDPDRLRAMGWGDDAALVTLQNPLSRERSVLRPSLDAGLLDVLALNANRATRTPRASRSATSSRRAGAEDADRPARTRSCGWHRARRACGSGGRSQRRDRGATSRREAGRRRLAAAAGAPGLSESSAAAHRARALSRRGPRRRGLPSTRPQRRPVPAKLALARARADVRFAARPSSWPSSRCTRSAAPATRRVSLPSRCRGSPRLHAILAIVALSSAAAGRGRGREAAVPRPARLLLVRRLPGARSARPPEPRLEPDQAPDRTLTDGKSTTCTP